jgi:SAM-dependent methyltransferase
MITSWSRGSAEDNMDEDILVQLSGIVSRHPWWTSRSNIALALLNELCVFPPADILEAGCGWGTNLRALEASGYRVTGLDISRKALARLDRADRQLIEADLSQPLPQNLPKYDCVLALDVIEHIDDDRRAVQELGYLVSPAGRLVLSVPALPELYSEFDEVQGHRRRYTAESLRSCVEQSGLMVQDILWWGQWMVRPLQTRKSRRRRRSGDTNLDVYRRYLWLPPWPGPWLMRVMFRIDQWRTLRRRNVTGTSLIAVAALRSAQGMSNALPRSGQ